MVAAWSWSFSSPVKTQEVSRSDCSARRLREAQPPATEWQLNTAGQSLPCSLVGDVLPAVNRLGPDCEFRGTLRIAPTAGGARGELAGTLEHVDFDALVTEQFPQQLSGEATVVIERAAMEQGRLVEIRGEIRAQKGAIGQSLLAAAQQHLGLQAGVELDDIAPQAAITFDQLAVGFQFSGAWLSLMRIAEPAGGGALLMNAGSPLLAAPEGHAATGASLLRTLVPDSQHQVPATRQTAALVRLLPLPDVLPAASEPPAHTPTRLRLRSRHRSRQFGSRYFDEVFPSLHLALKMPHDPRLQPTCFSAATMLCALGWATGLRGQDQPPPYEFAPPPPASYVPAGFVEMSPVDPAERLAALEREVQKLKESAGSKPANGNGNGPKPSFSMGGQLQIDYLSFGQDTASRDAVGDIQNGSDFRRARLTARGDAFEVVEYAIGFDFALTGRPSFLDVFVGVQRPAARGSFRVGHFFEPYSLERVTQNRYNTFMERSLADTFAPARNLGMMAHNTIGLYEHGTWAVGWFRSLSNDFGDDVGDEGEQAVTGRVTWLPFYDEADNGRSYLHLGAGYSFRGADEGIVMFGTTPEARLAANGEGSVPFFVNTGNIPAEHNQLFGAELAWIRGPFSFQTEFMHVPVKQIGGPELQFQAAYAQVSYFLTGEHRPYMKKFGIHDRVIPFENFFRVATDDGIATGKGAWEVAARWSWIDLDDANIQGGILYDTTLGLNWYLNPYTRVKWEYIRADLTNQSSGHTTTHIVGMRFDIDF